MRYSNLSQNIVGSAGAFLVLLVLIMLYITFFPLPSSKIVHETDAVRIFIGILTSYQKFGERQYLRETYRRMKAHFNPRDTITVKFILGKNEEEGMDRLLSWETKEWGDLVILEQLENMNNGKTWDYFKYLYQTHNGMYDYAMKLDDDTFLNIPALVDAIRPLSPPQGAYIGRRIGLDSPDGKFFMGGCGYVVSWDYVSYFAHNESLERNGNEDWLTADWIRGSGINTTNLLDLTNRVIDHPSTDLPWSDKLQRTTVMVHQVKSPKLWAQTLDYFASHVFHWP